MWGSCPSPPPSLIFSGVAINCNGLRQGTGPPPGGPTGGGVLSGDRTPGRQDPGKDPAPPGLPGGVTGTGGGTGPQVLDSPPGALEIPEEALGFPRGLLRPLEAPRRGQKEGVRKRPRGPLRAPGRSPGAWGFGAFCFVPSEGPNGLPYPRPAGYGSPLRPSASQGFRGNL